MIIYTNDDSRYLLLHPQITVLSSSSFAHYSNFVIFGIDGVQEYLKIIGIDVVDL